MLITDVQERIMSVFSRINKSLLDEFRLISLKDTWPEKLTAYKDIETDFKNYCQLGKDLIGEVESNISSSLRPVERTRYINNLNTFLDQIRDGYDYIESDEWLDKIFVSFGSLIPFNNRPVSAKLTEEDKKCITEIAEEARACCYEFVKVVDELTAESADPIPHLNNNMGAFNRSRTFDSPSHSFRPVTNNDSTAIPTSQSIQSSELNTQFQWRDIRGDKTDFAELVWALAKSHRVIDTKTGKPVTIDVLSNQLGALFGISVRNPMQLMQGRKDSYKATDGLTFVSSLSELVEKYIAGK